jgi:hypothetical protein
MVAQGSRQAIFRSSRWTGAGLTPERKRPSSITDSMDPESQGQSYEGVLLWIRGPRIQLFR